MNSPEWKATALEHGWEPDYKNSADARAYLDAEYPKLRNTLVELGLAK